MNCQDTSDRLSGFLDGALPDTEHEIVRLHLRSCAPCSQEYDALVATSGELRTWFADAATALPVTAPPLALQPAALMAARPRPRGAWMRWAVAAAAVVTAAVVFRATMPATPEVVEAATFQTAVAKTLAPDTWLDIHVKLAPMLGMLGTGLMPAPHLIQGPDGLTVVELSGMVPSLPDGEKRGIPKLRVVPADHPARFGFDGTFVWSYVAGDDHVDIYDPAQTQVLGHLKGVGGAASPGGKADQIFAWTRVQDLLEMARGDSGGQISYNEAAGWKTNASGERLKSVTVNSTAADGRPAFRAVVNYDETGLVRQVKLDMLNFAVDRFTGAHDRSMFSWQTYAPASTKVVSHTGGK